MLGLSSVVKAYASMNLKSSDWIFITITSLISVPPADVVYKLVSKIALILNFNVFGSDTLIVI